MAAAPALAMPRGDVLIGGRFHRNSDIELQLDRGRLIPGAATRVALPGEQCRLSWAESAATGQNVHRHTYLRTP
jgi:hypothetical protein